MKLFSIVATLLLYFVPVLHAADTQQPADKQITKAKQQALPDTGQTTRFTKTFGEDSDFVGTGPAYIDNGDGTVSDEVTGLTWQKADGGEMIWERAKEYAQKLKLGGHEDWRLPNSMELFGIMHHGQHGPAMNTEFFPRSDARYWWTDAPRADDESKIWVVNTGGGIGAHSKRETISAGGDRPIHVRCVRGNSTFDAGPRLHDNGNGTVTDQSTGLIWQKISTVQGMTWEEALRHCGTLRLADQSDWRLPNIKELRSVSDDCKVHPSLDKAFFPGAQAKYFWSSTSQSNRPERAWFVDFDTGLVSYSDKPEKLLVLAVRGGDAVPGSRIKSAPDLKLLEQGGEGRGPVRGKTKGSEKKKRP